jgi:norsolorinic acid ketoreductase
MGLTGIGYGLLQALLVKPNTMVIAGVRDPRASGKALKALPVASGTKLIVVKIDSTSATDATAAIRELKAEHGIQKLDVVIANAGLGHSWEKVLTTSAESIREYTEVNTIGPLVLFQAVYPLLAAATQPKFFVMATGVSSFGLMEHFPIPSAGYGASKAGVNYITRKIHFEHKNVISVCLYPGCVSSFKRNDFSLLIII